MKNYLDKFFILVACAITGILISMNFSSGRTARIFQMNSKEYKDASEERSSLSKEVANLREDNFSKSNKIQKYHLGESKHDKIVDDMRQQLKDYSELIGNTAVQGQGIILTIKDGDYDVSLNTKFEIERRTLHDIDAALILNELRNAGAEAIALNKYRILGDTSVQCDWAFIGFNDSEQSMEAQPFNFYAIGDPVQLKEAITAEGSHINKLIIRKLQVDIVESDNIIIPSTSKTVNPQFMQRADS